MALFDDIFIASDIDGTFFNDDGNPAARNLEAVEYFKSNGGLFTFITGRNMLNVFEDLPGLEKIINAPMVFCNGAGLYDARERKIVEKHLFDTETILQMARFVREKYPCIGLRASGADFVIADKMANAYIERDLDKFGGSGRFLKPFEEWRGLELYKLVVRGDNEELRVILPDLYERFGDVAEICLSGRTIIDMQIKGRNKGVMLAELSARLGGNRTVYGAGDCFNDIEMLERADVSCCPSSAEPEVKPFCRLILCDNNEGIIADMVEHIENEKLKKK